ncbi:hypothetical protein ACHAWF_004384 [Thalassiosira exigua]
MSCGQASSNTRSTSYNSQRQRPWRKQCIDGDDKMNRNRSSSAHAGTQSLIIFNSVRTALILSTLLACTIVVQIALVVNHDEFVRQMRLLEEDMAVVNSIATDAVNGAYEFNNGSSVERGSVLSHRGRGPPDPTEMRASNFANYSMEPIEILKRAGVDYSAGFIPSITVSEARAAKKWHSKSNLRQQAELPSLRDIQAMYGNRSYTLGLDRCEEFKRVVKPKDRLMGPAGMFNSATNLLNKLLKLNCVNVARNDRRARVSLARTGMLLQAPWGKHNPVSWRLHHEAAVGGKGVQQENFLPIVMIKDPITWMASMCRHSYEARWRHTSDHCPNLVPNEYDRGRRPGEGTMGVRAKWATKHIGDEPIPDKKNRTFVNYDSLVDLWNIWYKDWHSASFPRLMVRFEDLMFHAEETVTQVCECGGGTMKPVFKYVEESAKGESGPHAGSAGFLASLVTYGNRTLRMEGILTDNRDALYARQNLDKELMELFGYAPI